MIKDSKSEHDVCVGECDHKWLTPPQFITRASENLPQSTGIPGFSAGLPLTYTLNSPYLE